MHSKNIVDLSKIPMIFFKEMEKFILKFIWNLMGPQIAKTILKKKTKVRGLILPGFKIYYKATRIKTVWYCHRNRHTNQWNKIKIPKINPHIYGQMILTRVQRLFNMEKTAFPTNSAVLRFL